MNQPTSSETDSTKVAQARLVMTTLLRALEYATPKASGASTKRNAPQRIFASPSERRSGSCSTTSLRWLATFRTTPAPMTLAPGETCSGSVT